MATESVKVYFDSCVLLAVLLPNQDGAEDARSALSAAQQNITLGHTSALVVAETIGNAKLRAPQGIPATERDRRIDLARDFILGCGFRYVDATARAGTLAMQYAIEFQLSAPDALHLALATMSGCDELHTFDRGLLAVGDKVAGLEVCTPRVDQLPLI